MNVSGLRAPRYGLAILFPVLAAACSDSLPTAPGPAPVTAAGIPAMQCTVDVRGGAMFCAALDPALANQAIAANRLLGGQDVYVKLTNVGGSYDSGAEVFEINVTLQNLLTAPLGTSDGTTIDGVKVFFADGPNVTSGTGEVTLLNASTGFFLGPDQPYFLYNVILDPNEISASQPWRFSVPTTVDGFRFNVYVQGPQADESQPLLDRVWDGSTSTDWAEASNWEGSAPPDSGSSAAIPPDSLLPVTAQLPVLGADARLTHLRVGFGSSLGLGGNTLTAWGNVDAVGAIGSGTVWMRGGATLLRGTVPGLTVSGTVSTQGAAKATGPVNVTGGGSLTLSNHAPLTIINP